MWISARLATILSVAALLLIMGALAAPLLPKPKLPQLPEERASTSAPILRDPAQKFGDAEPIFAAPDRVRTQRMAKADLAKLPAGAARLESASLAGTGAAIEPNAEIVKRLVLLLHDSRTVSDPRAAEATPTCVVRLVKGEQKVDVMIDAKQDRVVVALDGKPVGTYGTYGLHREFLELERSLWPQDRS